MVPSRYRDDRRKPELSKQKVTKRQPFYSVQRETFSSPFCATNPGGTGRAGACICTWLLVLGITEGGGRNKYPILYRSYRPGKH